MSLLVLVPLPGDTRWTGGVSSSLEVKRVEGEIPSKLLSTDPEVTAGKLSGATLSHSFCFLSYSWGFSFTSSANLNSAFSVQRYSGISFFDSRTRFFCYLVASSSLDGAVPGFRVDPAVSPDNIDT